MSDNIFQNLASELDLTLANAEDYYGQIKSHPVILTSLGSCSPSVMFKIRINSEDQHNIELPEELSESLAQEKINISIENGYGWLTIYDLSGFNAKDVSGLLDIFLQAIEINDLNIGTGCAVCKDESTGQIHYSDGSINRLCPDCLKAKQQQRTVEQNKSCEIKTSSILIIFSGFVCFSVIWAAIWFLYDYMFELSHTDTIEVPDVVIGGAILIAILVLGATIGIPLRRLKIRNKILLIVTASLLTMTSFVLGEVLNTMAWVFKYNRIIDISASMQIYIDGWQDEPPIFKAIKVLLVVLSIAVIYVIAKKEKVVTTL
jgi:hypothetical protein